MAGGSQNRPIAVALIGATALIIVGILSYLGATGGLSDSTFDYTGVVREADKTPVSSAKVRIAEDQQVPQTVLTDSEGVFHARLKKKTLNITIDVSAEGFEPITLNVQSSRTGAEPIILTKKTPRPDGHSSVLADPASLQQVSSTSKASVPVEQQAPATTNTPQQPPAARDPYSTASAFLKAHMTPQLGVWADTNCCVETYSYEFVSLEDCKLIYKESIEIIHHDGKPNAVEAYTVNVFLASIHPDNIESGRSPIVSDYNQIAFTDPTASHIKVFETSGGYPKVVQANEAAFIENSFGEEQDDFVRDLRTIATSCRAKS